MTTDVKVGQAEYLTCAQTAKLVRKELGRVFPGYTFTVRSNVYAGGASIDAAWTDGPPAKVVDSVVSGFAGGGFDGSIDMKYHVSTWLEPDGTAYLAECNGTEGSRGYVPESMSDPRSADARLVYMGADFVFTNRTLTPSAEALIYRKVADKYGADWRERYPGYEGDRRVHETASRWLFPPCEYTYSVSLLSGTVEASGLTKTEATKVAKANQKAGSPRGHRYVNADRKAS